MYYNNITQLQSSAFVYLYIFAGGDPGAQICQLLKESVRKRLMGVRRIGCLLSGGLDSSLIASLVTQVAKEVNLGYKIQTFSIGMEEVQIL